MVFFLWVLHIPSRLQVGGICNHILPRLLASMVFFFEGHFSLFTQDFLLFIFDQATFSLFSRVSSQQSPRFTIGDCRFSFLLSFMLWAFLLLFICSGHVHAVSFISFSVSFPIIVSSLFPITLDCITLVLRSYCKKFSSLVFLMSFFYPWIRSKFWCTRYWFYSLHEYFVRALHNISPPHSVVYVWVNQNESSNFSTIASKIKLHHKMNLQHETEKYTHLESQAHQHQ